MPPLRMKSAVCKHASVMINLRNLFRNDFTTLLARLALLYILWALCRVMFYLTNHLAIGPLSWAELPGLLHGALAFDTVSILYVNALFILLSLLPFRFRERPGYRRALKILFLTVNILALLVNVADGVYFRNARKRFTSDEFSYLSNNDNNLPVVLKAIGENWWLLLWFALLVGLLIYGYRKINYQPTRIRNRWAYFGVNLALLLLSVGLVIGAIRGGFSRQTRPITLSNATQYTSSSTKANLILSNPFCILRTAGNPSITYTKFFDQATLDSLYTPYHYPQGEAPILGRRNVVLFILESFSAEHSGLLNPDLYPDGQGFTPFLDSLMREGYYFTNAYANGRKSIEALPSVLSSIPSYRTSFVLMPQALSRMDAMPNLLAEQGYATSFFNGSSRGSMGFGAYATLAGIQTYYSREDYEAAHGRDDFDGYWGIWDEPFLQYMAETLAHTPQPFFASVFTLTSHHPFVVPDRYRDSLPKGKTKVHPGVAYTDMALRRFMETAAQEPWYDSTLFVFVADHVSSETFAPKTLTPTGNTHILYFLYTPDGALRGADTGVTQQIDIMPTVLGLLGNRKPYFAFGRDVLHEPDRRAMAVNGVGENYQAITDSMVLYFNGNEAVSAFALHDTLQRHDLLSTHSPYLEKMETDLKARLQQYYQHVEKGDYLVKPIPSAAATRPETSTPSDSVTSSGK